MAELANPLPWVTGAIGFDPFGSLTAVPDVALVVLVPEFCQAFPPAILEPRCVRWRIHQLMDCCHCILLLHILPCNPSVLNQLPRQLVAELLEGRDRIGTTKETVCEVGFYLTNLEYKVEHSDLPASRCNGMLNRRESRKLLWSSPLARSLPKESPLPRSLSRKESPLSRSLLSQVVSSCEESPLARSLLL